MTYYGISFLCPSIEIQVLVNLSFCTLIALAVRQLYEKSDRDDRTESE